MSADRVANSHSNDLEELVPTDPEVEAFLAEVAQEGAELVADLAYEPTPRDRVAERARLAQRLAREETGDWIPERSSMPEPAEFDSQLSELSWLAGLEWPLATLF